MFRSSTSPDITILGAGPIGLEAALYALHCGYSVRVVDQAEPGHHLDQWGFVRLFSPFSMNHTPLGSKLLTSLGHRLPPDRAYLTGREHREAYVLPLAEWLSRRVEWLMGRRVVAVSREGLLKGEALGRPERAEAPFRILLEDETGREQVVHSPVVIDATGSYSNPNWLGDGGIPAPGERALRNRIHYHLVDIAGQEKKRFLGKTTLVVGNGYSAATSIVALSRLMEKEPRTRAVWLTRTTGQVPILPIENDPLEERARITRQANQCVQQPGVRWIPGGMVHALQASRGGRKFLVEIVTGKGMETVEVDQILAQVGYSPDHRIYRELQVHECFASLGPMKLAAALLSDGSTDCLTQSSAGPETLKNPEPNFFILGMKSYGRNSHFLLRVGFEQIRDLFQLLTGEAQLNLYQEPVPTHFAPVQTIGKSCS